MQDGNWWCEAGDYEIDLTLWQKGFKVAIKATSGMYIKPDLSHDNVRTLAANMSQEIATLMSITPKPYYGFYLSHSSYAHLGRGEWRTRVKHYNPRKKFEDKVVEYRLKEMDHEDLAHEFACLQDEASFQPRLPRFVTG